MLHAPGGGVEDGFTTPGEVKGSGIGALVQGQSLSNFSNLRRFVSINRVDATRIMSFCRPLVDSQFN
jgi:hypothetical protein